VLYHHKDLAIMLISTRTDQYKKSMQRRSNVDVTTSNSPLISQAFEL